jgi:predicted DNA-binding transcriptional regulator AlpA
MTARKSDIPLTPRLTAYVSREAAAAELQISPSTFDDMVECGQIPKPVRLGRMGRILRWRWIDIDNAISGEERHGPDQEPYFRERSNGTKKDCRRVAA